MHQTCREKGDADLAIDCKTLDKFFQEANEKTRQCELYDPMGYLMVSNEVPDQVDQHTTTPPIDKDALDSNPFQNMSTNEIIAWAEANLPHSGLSTDNMIILDGRTAEDETCILVSLRDLPDEELSSGFGKWKVVRSDFESSIISLMVKETGVGGDDHLDTDYEGSDGVLRTGVRDRSG